MGRTEKRRAEQKQKKEARMVYDVRNRKSKDVARLFKSQRSETTYTISPIQLHKIIEEQMKVEREILTRNIKKQAIDEVEALFAYALQEVDGIGIKKKQAIRDVMHRECQAIAEKMLTIEDMKAVTRDDLDKNKAIAR